ncbi:MAG TPA: PVC-type heme-binding CxxCH protein [Pirellulales bacterium]|nr:PVC-type heme-binding CxxCH protein [Pirellulales bacterium]
MKHLGRGILQTANWSRRIGACAILALSTSNMLRAAEPAAQAPPAPMLVPHGQNRAPGPALSPSEAMARMTVPEGFSVELVAAEPDLVNPVAMTFDERGRIWVTESLEYPRREPGPGRDRVKILEDTNHDGRADRFTIFADGLNIPSGIAVGAGGAWVANAPDILFLQDTNGDDRADRREVVVTGFGRDDTHELPNSLTWGPDGWLYGLNGVFNRSVVRQDDRELRFTAAMFRIDPRTRHFELFAEGTSNPWGIAWDHAGSAFVSACVIDHLWHLVETGYYHRQAGAYPPFTWKIESIVKHHHQQAAYCGIHFFDSDAYPAEYRGKLYMGNIHGNCINCDAIARNGATYAGRPEKDFLSANDAWFMPVVQKTGPDGCLYILDWYDRYHCYQDANRDPAGIDRGRGRLYRVRYKDTPRAGALDLAQESTLQLVERLRSPNVFFRDIAQRLLAERAEPEALDQLEQLVLDDTAPRTARMHALWALLGAGALDPGFHSKLLEHNDADLRAWGVRAAGNQRTIAVGLRHEIVTLAADPAPEVRLQVAIAAGKIADVDTVDLLVEVLCRSADDPLIPHIVWQNLHPRLERDADRCFAALARDGRRESPGAALILPRLCERLLATRPLPAEQIARALTLAVQAADAQPVFAEAGVRCLDTVADEIRDRELAESDAAQLQKACAPLVATLRKRADHDSLRVAAVLLAASWNDATAVEAAREILVAPRYSDAARGQALEALVTLHDEKLLTALKPLFAEGDQASTDLQRRVLGSLARLDHDDVALLALEVFSRLAPELQPQAVGLLTSRPAWGRKLLQALADGAIDRSAVNASHIRKLLAAGDNELRDQVARVWGTLREERSQDRENVIRQTRQLVRTSLGDPAAGRLVFRKVCGNCHKIYGEGQEVGPDLTVNGRGSYEQLISNVLDPSLVIGAAYQARTVVTDDGRILTGLLVEDSPQRVVLKQQGGKLETIPRDGIAEMDTSKLSLMPEDLDRQLTPQQLVDLLTFLALDRAPEDPEAKWLSGFDGPAAR